MEARLIEVIAELLAEKGDDWWSWRPCLIKYTRRWRWISSSGSTGW